MQPELDGFENLVESVGKPKRCRLFNKCITLPFLLFPFGARICVYPLLYMTIGYLLNRGG
ncbi:hypothetical protein DESC_610061 [Desulfosarcina cetonica]|nr:hypothetical protein DESC_610061 [Desulfosarcina cetonica]